MAAARSQESRPDPVAALLLPFEVYASLVDAQASMWSRFLVLLAMVGLSYWLAFRELLLGALTETPGRWRS